MERRILVVEDHRALREEVCQALAKNGYQVFAAGDTDLASAIFARETIDLILLDVKLPGESGLSFCASLRRRSAVPVIFLTSMQSDEDRIRGLRLGADDYLGKPFRMEELLLRVGAVLRRGEVRRAPPSTELMRVGPWRLDLRSRELMLDAERRLTLSTAELRLVQVFLDANGKALSREDVRQGLLRLGANVSPRSIDNMVARLRKKLDAMNEAPSFLVTVWGRGYRLAHAVSEETDL